MTDKWRARFPKNTALNIDECEVIFSAKDANGDRVERVGIMKVEDAEVLNELIAESFKGVYRGELE